MALRAVWTCVLMCWLAGPLAGGGCLRACPATAVADTAGACHSSAPGFLFTGTHDCGSHFAPANDLVPGTARKDVTPAPRVHVTTVETVTTGRVPEPRPLAASSPPTTFLPPLRQ